MTWRPIKPLDDASPALDTVAWSVVLGEPLVQSHQAALQRDDTEIRRLLPDKGPDGLHFQVRLDADGRPVNMRVGEGPEHPASLSYSRGSVAGGAELELKINGFVLSVVSRKYDRWTNAKDEVLRLFSHVGLCLREAPVPVQALELIYKDVFWWDGDWQPDAITCLFGRNDTTLIPDWLFKMESIWHNDVGREVSHDGERYVERLAVRCVNGHVEDHPRRMVVMDTTTRWVEKDREQYLHAIFADGAGERHYETMHDIAKGMFVKVLADDMRRQLNVL